MVRPNERSDVLPLAVMVVIGAVIVLLPFVVTYTLNGRNQADSRGRRISRRWQGRSLLR